MSRALPWLPILLTACTATTEIGEDSYEETQEDTLEEEETERASMSFSVALQRGDWGASVTRCQVEVAFMDAGREDGLWEGANAAVVERPEEPGSCIHTSFDDEEPALGLWQVRGDRQAGESLWLHGREDSLELMRQTDEDGRVFYGLEACSEALFPFGEVLDIEVPGDDGPDGLSGFDAEDAFVVGPDIVITELSAPLDETARLELSVGQDLTLTWDYLQDLPVAGGALLDHVPYLMIRNQRQGEEQPFEAVACQPDIWGEITVPADMLALLEPLDDEATGDPYLAVQLDAWYEGPKVLTPWGSSTRVLSMVTEGGIALLRP